MRLSKKTVTSLLLTKKFEKMSGVKRTTVRVLSAIAFLALVALAVYGTDFITGFIKGLFG